jgi:hypothetical protein
MKWLFISFLAYASAAQQAGDGAVTGQIRLRDGTAAAGVRVSAVPVANSELGANALTVLASITETDSSGRYRLSDIPSGRYYIIAGTLDAPTYYPGVRGVAGARILTIESGSNIEAVDFEVQRVPSAPLGTGRGPSAFRLISGTVVTEDGKPLPIFLPKLYVLVENGMKRTTFGEDGARIRGTGTFGATPVSRDGGFNLSLRDGEYAISVITGLGDVLSAGDGYYVKSISLGSTNLLKEKLRVNGPISSRIVITIAAGPGRGK